MIRKCHSLIDGSALHSLYISSSFIDSEPSHNRIIYFFTLLLLFVVGPSLFHSFLITWTDKCKYK